MSDSTRLPGDLRALAKTPGTYTEKRLDAKGGRPSLAWKMGIGAPDLPAQAQAASSTGAASSYQDVCVAYSQVLVQEAGVFELPPGWPNDNTYPGVSFAEADLPVTWESYVIEEREHAVLRVAPDGTPVAIHRMPVWGGPFTTKGSPLVYPLNTPEFTPKVLVRNHPAYPLTDTSKAAQAASVMLGVYGI